MERWLTLMGLTDKAFNKNFFVAVVLTLLFFLVASVTLLVKEINEVSVLQKDFLLEVAKHESEKRTIILKNDSMRYVEYRISEYKIDSISKIVYRILIEKQIIEK